MGIRYITFFEFQVKSIPGYNFGYFWAFWRIFFGYTGIPLPPPGRPWLFKWRVGLSFRNFATMTTWHHVFSSLLGSGKVGVLFYIHVSYQTQSTVVCVGLSIFCFKYFHFYSDSGLKESMEPNIRQLQISTRLEGDNLISEHSLNVVCAALYFLLSLPI